jgi:hypothetical protein
MWTCFGCHAPITRENDSEAHIIPKALGGRLAPKGLICRGCNNALDAAADNALVNAFHAWPTFLEIPRQGGQNPAKVVDTQDGGRVKIGSDGSLIKTDLAYNVTSTQQGLKGQIAAGGWKELRQLLKRAEKQFPTTIDTSLLEQQARVVEISPENIRLGLWLDYGPPAVFGGVVTAIWLFCLYKTGSALMPWEQLLSYIKQTQTTGGRFRYLMDGLPGLEGPQIDIGHKLVVRSVPASGELIAYVEILGILKIGGIIANASTPAPLIEHIYAYDVIGKSECTAQFSIDPARFEVQDWETVGLGPTDVSALETHFKEAQLNLHRRRFGSESQGDAS